MGAGEGTGSFDADPARLGGGMEMLKSLGEGVPAIMQTLHDSAGTFDGYGTDSFGEQCTEQERVAFAGLDEYGRGISGSLSAIPAALERTGSEISGTQEQQAEKIHNAASQQEAHGGAPETHGGAAEPSGRGPRG